MAKQSVNFQDDGSGLVSNSNPILTGNLGSISGVIGATNNGPNLKDLFPITRDTSLVLTPEGSNTDVTNYSNNTSNVIKTPGIFGGGGEGQSPQQSSSAWTINQKLGAIGIAVFAIGVIIYLSKQKVA
jgi:hypothetical protein